MSFVYSCGAMEEYGHPSILILSVGFLAAGLWEFWKGRSRVGSIPQIGPHTYCILYMCGTKYQKLKLGETDHCVSVSIQLHGAGRVTPQEEERVRAGD